MLQDANTSPPSHPEPSDAPPGWNQEAKIENSQTSSQGWGLEATEAGTEGSQGWGPEASGGSQAWDQEQEQAGDSPSWPSSQAFSDTPQVGQSWLLIQCLSTA